MLETYIRGRIERFLDPIGRALARLRVTPTFLTLLGLGLSIGAAFLIGNGRLVLGGWTFVAGSILDGLDGTVARVTGTASKRGALVDSVADRMGEIAVWSGITVYVLDQPRLVILCVLALGGALLTSYLRAKAESIGADGRGGTVGRGERVTLLAVGLILGPIEVILWVLAALIWFTVFQRFAVIWKRLEA